MHATAFPPQVSSAIRNQFNKVTEMLDDGTSENAFKTGQKIGAETGEVL